MVTLKIETEANGDEKNFALNKNSGDGSKINLNLSPEDFYGLCLEMDKARQQMELISQKVTK